jgi:hypothetical protein
MSVLAEGHFTTASLPSGTHGFLGCFGTKAGRSLANAVHVWALLCKLEHPSTGSVPVHCLVFVLLPCRTIRYTGRADTIGNKTNTATLVLVDSIESNNGDSVIIPVATNCSDPFNNGTAGACSAGTEFVGAGFNITALDQFQTTCCVSSNTTFLGG